MLYIVRVFEGEDVFEYEYGLIEHAQAHLSLEKTKAHLIEYDRGNEKLLEVKEYQEQRRETMTIYKVTPRIVQQTYYVKANSPEEAVDHMIWRELPDFEYKFETEQVDVVNMLTEQSCVGDLVRCSWCEKVMIVNTGEDVCPTCNTAGSLAWIEGCPEEVEL